MARSINCQLLELARLSRKLSQTEAARLLNISQGKLCKAETGQQDISEDILNRIVQLYGYPAEFFYQDHDSSPEGHMYFRRRLTESKKTIDAFLANIKICKLAIDKLLKPVELPDFTIGSYDVNIDSPDEIARKVRYQLRIPKGPIPDLVGLLENNGIVIVKLNFGTEKIDGLSTITQAGNKVIFLNETMPNDRIRYSLAHELGHMLMHLEHPPKFKESVEDEADLFASEFLMPQAEIAPLLSDLSWPALADLKRYWRVSMRSLVRRAYSLEIIDKVKYRQLQIRFSQKGYNRKEPINLPIENPSIIRETIDLYKTNLGYTDADIQKVLFLNENEYNQWLAKRPKIVSISISKSS